MQPIVKIRSMLACCKTSLLLLEQNFGIQKMGVIMPTILIT
jgi:hypothetical protein